MRSRESNRSPMSAGVALVCLGLLPGDVEPLRAQEMPAADVARTRLVTQLRHLESLSGGRLGVAAIHLETGRRVDHRGDEPFPMASTYKVPIAVQLLTRVDRGEVSLADMVELGPQDLHPGSGTLSRLFDDPGVALSLRNLMELMLLISDNSATDLTLAAAGGAVAVTERMHALGIEGLRVDRPTSLLIADYAGIEGAPEDGLISPDMWRQLSAEVDVEERQAAAAEFANDLRDTSTPSAMGELLRLIWHGEAMSAENTELFLDVMRRVETGTERIKGILPPGTTVAHKTGTIGGTTNDVGIIYLPGDAGHVAIVTFVKDSGRPIPERERAIAHAARAVYDFFLFNPGG